MEEKILKIIKEYWGSSQEGAAKEITSMVMEFIEWIATNEKFLFETDRDIDNNVLAWGFGDYEKEEIKRYTTEEVFGYWFNNIRNKQ